MAFSDKKKMTEYVNNRNKEKYDRIGVMAPKGEGDTIKAAAERAGMSANAYILEAIREKMSRDVGGAETVSPGPETASGALSPPGGTDSPGTLENASGDD